MKFFYEDHLLAKLYNVIFCIAICSIAIRCGSGGETAVKKEKQKDPVELVMEQINVINGQPVTSHMMPDSTMFYIYGSKLEDGFPKAQRTKNSIDRVLNLVGQTKEEITIKIRSGLIVINAYEWETPTYKIAFEERHHIPQQDSLHFLFWIARK